MDAPESRRPAWPDHGNTVDSVEMSSSGPHVAEQRDPAFPPKIPTASLRSLLRLPTRSCGLLPSCRH